jgi:DNA polymerase bacteriophage-type
MYELAYIDIETRSQVDLIKHGLMRYATDKSTQLISMAYAFDDEDVKFWWGMGSFPQEVLDYIKSGKPIVAHNADFERHLFDYVIGPDFDFDAPKLTQWRCSMALSLASGFPAGLDGACVAAGVPYAKNTAGTRLIKEYCAPGHNDIFDEEKHAEDRALMVEYNISDVECMRALVKCCRWFTDDEWYEYHLTCRINERGLPIDVDFADQALGYANEIADDANLHISELTGGKMTKHTQRKARDAWLLPKLTDVQLKLLAVYKKGVKKISLDSDHRQYLLNCEDLNADARELLEYINDAGSAALKKYSVAYHQNVGGRVYNTFLWNGAGRTGRFSGKGLQPHNMRRDVYSHNEAESYIQDILQQLELTSPAETMARLSRAMIKSDKGLYWVDWSAIEGRIAPWLSVSEAGDAKLDLYIEGRDVYVVTAADMFDFNEQNMLDRIEDGDAEAKDFRQSGKIAELSLQFGGGSSALIGMAKNYGVTFEEDEASSIVRLWRRANPWAVNIWAEYQRAIDGAVSDPGAEYPVGRVTYFSDGGQFLWCQLPSGRMLAYPRPRMEMYVTPWGEERYGPTFQTHFKPAAVEPALRNYARGALLFQNTVQACAADLLREALVEADLEGLKIVGSVHDEIVGEGDEKDGHLLNSIMLEVPDWASGLPLATGGVATGKRYGK